MTLFCAVHIKVSTWTSSQLFLCCYQHKKFTAEIIFTPTSRTWATAEQTVFTINSHFFDGLSPFNQKLNTKRKLLFTKGFVLAVIVQVQLSISCHGENHSFRFSFPSFYHNQFRNILSSNSFISFQQTLQFEFTEFLRRLLSHNSVKLCKMNGSIIVIMMLIWFRRWKEFSCLKGNLRKYLREDGQW